MILGHVLLGLVTLLSTFFFWHHFLKKVHKGVYPRVDWVVCTFITAPIFYSILFLALTFSDIDWFFHERFTFEKWHSQKEKRYKIARDLLQSQLLINKSDTEIVRLLGANVYPNNSIICYYLGTPPNPFEIEGSRLLWIRTANHKAVEVQIGFDY